MKNNVIIGFVGSTLDIGRRRRWRPSIAATRFPDLPVARFELIHQASFADLARRLQREIETENPETEVLLHEMTLKDPWDITEVYGALFDFARNYGFDDEREDYFVHLTTGTHAAQICWFLLTESRHIPARLLQTSPPPRGEDGNGDYFIVDLDLAKYGDLQQRFDLVAEEYNSLLKAGIETRNPEFNSLIERIELVAGRTDAPLLLQGATGTGKTELAMRIHELKLQNRRVRGRFVHLNCSTLRGDRAQSTLFGHRRGAFGSGTGDRRGLLREADGGVLFLDEVDQLGLDEQAMILHAVENGSFFPLGSDHEITSRFHLIAGANRDLSRLVAAGQFRADLFARLNLWTFTLPSLRDRREDIAPNIEYELARAERVLGTKTLFSANGGEKYLNFATDPATPWPGNFRDLGASVMRMCTLAPRGRITRSMVEREVTTLHAQWAGAERNEDADLVQSYLGAEATTKIDAFDLVQLALVIRTCETSKTLSAAGRALFAASRATRTSRNDADRLRKYLAKFGLGWDQFAGQDSI